MLRPALIALALTPALLLASCSDDDTSADPSVADTSSNPAPTRLPAAPGPVHTNGTITVMDTGTPEMCVGPIAESYPPQCTGPEITNWDWSEQKMFQTEGDVRFGAYALTGTWDGEAFTVEKAVPAALYDPPKGETPSEPPPPLRQYGEHDLAEFATEVNALPGVAGVQPTQFQVLADVPYDDGTYQAWADLEFGSNTVVFTPALLDD